MSELVGNHIVGFPTRWLIYIYIYIYIYTVYIYIYIYSGVMAKNPLLHSSRRSLVIFRGETTAKFHRPRENLNV